MSRPLLISDCDEVLLHMVVPFRDWLDEAHHIHFDLVHGDWGEALRHKHDGTQVERARGPNVCPPTAAPSTPSSSARASAA